MSAAAPAPLSARTEFRTLFLLSAPVALSQLGMMTTSVVDTMMVARVGLAELAAVAVSSTWAWSSHSIGQGIVQGMDPIVSQAHGEGDGEGAALALQRGLVVAVAVAIPIGGLWLATEDLLLAFGQDPRVAELAQAYMVARLPSVFGSSLYIALRQYLAGRGITRPSMWCMFASNVMNIFFNWVFIFGNLGAPALGLVGAGIATSIASVALPLMLWAWMLRYRLHEGAWRRWDRRSFAWRGLRRYVALGLPVGLQLSLEANAFTLAMMMVGWIGVVELGAHQVVINMASFTFMAPMGVAIGASARAGNLIGRRDAAGLRLACRMGFLMGGGIMALAAVSFVVFRNELPLLYTRDAPVIALAATLLPIAGAFQIADGLQVVGGGLMRGMGRPQAGAIVNLVGFYVIALPLAYLLAFPLELGMIGIWWGLAAGLGCVAGMLVVWVTRTSHKPITALVVGAE